MMTDDFATALSKIRPHTTSKQDHQRKPAQLLVALESTLQESSTLSNPSGQLPTAYFAALLTTLEGCIAKGDVTLNEGDTLPAILYLLALVLPYVPEPVLRSHMSKIFQLLPPLLPLAVPSHAPSLRSLITIFGTAIMAMDQGQIISTISSVGSTSSNTAVSVAIRQTFSSILELVIDPRPKVRKRAGEIVKNILESPPSPLLNHPWSSLVAEWSCGVVAQTAGAGSGKKGSHSDGLEKLIHLLAFLRTVPLIFAPAGTDLDREQTGESSLEVMTRYLLAMPKLSNPYLTQASYQLLTALLSPEMEDDEDDVYTQQKRGQAHVVLRTLLTNAPSKIDHQIAPYWLSAIARATVASHARSSTTHSEVIEIWNVVWAFLDATCSEETRSAAGDALKLIVTGGCIAIDEMREGAKGQLNTIGSISDLIGRSLSQLAFASSIKEILVIAATLAEASSPLRPSFFRNTLDTDSMVDPSTLRSADVVDPANQHEKLVQAHPLLPLLSIVAQLRNIQGFEYKENADQFLSSMMRAIGVDGVLAKLPLGLLPSERATTQPNAYLLPLIPAHHPTPLSHFAEYFIPLSEALWEIAQNSEKDAEKKVYRVLMEQIWNAFPSYCWGCWDLRQTFTSKLAERLTQVIYHEPGLRAPILRGLKALVDGNSAALNIVVDEDETDDDEETDDEGSDVGIGSMSKVTARQDGDAPLITEDEARKNIEYLNKQAKSWLAVLFNVFTGMEKDSRSMVGEVISAWAGIANEPELAGAYQNVLSHLKQNLSTTPEKHASTPKSQKEAKLAHQMLDILLLLVPYLPVPQLKEVVNLCLEKRAFEHSDSGVQKLGYRVLGRVVICFVESDSAEDEKHAMVERVLTDAGSGVDVSPGAVKERLTFLALLIPYLQSNSLHLLVSHLMEAIMGVKEHSEKSRKAAFELLVVMGLKMGEGGSIRMDILNGGVNESDAEGMERDANIEEFVKMVGASLAADRDHTISAGVMSLSRVLFEFKDDVSEASQADIIATVYPLLGVKNREIVKSVLGFVKLSIHSLSSTIVEPQLDTLVPALLMCLSAHRHHFKVKIRHIFERLLRKYGADTIEKYAISEDQANDGGLKMILNIKKRKERAARKRREAAMHGDENSDEETTRKAATGDAFEDVLYGSESEIEDSEVENDTREMTNSRGDSKKKGKKSRVDSETRLRIDDEEPLDLLDGTISKLSKGGAKRRKPGFEATKFKTDEDTGKMIIADSDSDVGANTSKLATKPSVNDALAGAAYRETLVSVDGFTRNPNGTIKFHKDTKKRRKEEMEMEMDVDVDDATRKKHAAGPHRTPKKKPARVGQEFKAKKAGGDVKRNGVDPYAYLTLGQTAGGRKGRGKAKVSIVGK